MEMWSDCLIIMGYLHMKYKLAFSFPLCTICEGLAWVLKEMKCAVGHLLKILCNIVLLPCFLYASESVL